MDTTSDDRRSPPSRRRVVLVFGLLTSITSVGAVSYPLRIGAIFHDGDEQHKAVFEYAVAQLRTENAAPAFELQPIVKWVNSRNDSFQTEAAACELLDDGVMAIFGTSSPKTRGIVSSVAAEYGIPHVEYTWRSVEESVTPATTVNLHPNGGGISQGKTWNGNATYFFEAIANLVEVMNWKGFTVVYETDEGLSRVQDALGLPRPEGFPVTVRQLGSGPDWRPLLKEIKSSNEYSILLDVSTDRIVDVLDQAKNVSLLCDYYQYIITDLDMSRLSIPTVLNESKANITGFRLLTDAVDDLSEALGFNVKVESALLYDSVFLLYKALEILNVRTMDSVETSTIDPPPLSCEKPGKYEPGSNITSIMREFSKEGKLSGRLTFDEEGRRDFELWIAEYQQNRMKKTGIWTTEGIRLTRSSEELEGDIAKSIEKKFFRVSTKEGAPYCMEVKDGSNRGILIENKRYEGYSIDLIDAIANLLHFKYEFELVPDKQYGAYNKETKSWNGLVKRLLDRAADLALCDLTITYQRKTAVDFTMPFMTTGISILYSKPAENPPKLFSFLSPFSNDVWIYMATAYLGVSIMLFVQARIAPGEWNNPHPCNPNPEELENSFDLTNSLWLTMGSLMQQGSDILPRTPSIRMVASLWWFFVLIFVSSYTANLAAFLTADKMESTVKSAEDLAKQTKIKYGVLKGGSTSLFFKESNLSIYQRMWTTMTDAKPSVFMEDNDAAVERVLKDPRYAFFMESTTIEYKLERECKLMQVGGLLDNKGYGIAMPMNSAYRTTISGAVLKLQEKGTLADLKKKWWKDMRKGEPCKSEDDDQSSSTGELRMANVGGVFLVLMCGCAVSFVIAVVEFLWNARKVAMAEKITFGEALTAELKFVVNIWADKKPVNVTQSGSGTSSAVGGFGRAASVARSMVGSFLRLDKLDKFDMENDTNDRNDGGKVK